MSEARLKGVYGAQPIAFYATEEAHFTVDRAADLLGLGEDSVRKIAIDADNRMVVADLERQIAADIQAGVTPAAIIGNGGTTGTGSIDPLEQLSEVARSHDCWFHVDAASGGAAVLSDELRPLLPGSNVPTRSQSMRISGCMCR